MSFTQGELFYYGGMMAIGLLLFISVILVIVFRHNKKSLLKNINNEY